jgi:hypothetical protein
VRSLVSVEENNLWLQSFNHTLDKYLNRGAQESYEAFEGKHEKDRFRISFGTGVNDTEFYNILDDKIGNNWRNWLSLS